ncbi:MAG: hypothetical protein ACXWVS_03850 [Hyphomicrobium sp.]|jgi:hypothetical protein
MFGAIPFLAIIVIAYNVIALLTGPALSHAGMSATLPSGAAWTLTAADLLIIVGIALLFLEIAKATPVAAGGGRLRAGQWCCSLSPANAGRRTFATRFQ